MAGSPGSLTEFERRLVDAVNNDVRLIGSDGVPDRALPGHTVRAQVVRDILLGRWGAEPGPRGLRLQGAYVTGQLDLADVQVPCALQLARCRFTQQVILIDAHVPKLALPGSHLTGLEADRLRVEGSMMLADLVCESPDDEYAVRLLGAQVGGQLSLTDATLRAAGTCALHGDGLRVDGDMLLRGRFRAEGGPRGAVRLIGARVGGDLDFEGARLHGHGGPALHAERLEVGGNLYLRQVRAEGHGLGAVVLAGGRVSGQLSCTGAALRGVGGPALLADGLESGGDVFVDHGFQARATGGGAVRLIGARVGGHLDCTGGQAVAAEPEHSALDLRYASVGHAIHLPASFTRPDAGTPEGGRGGSGGSDGSGGLVALDGLTYPAVPRGMDRDEWLATLRDGTPAYAAQPYQQLAAAYQAAGREQDARTVLVAQQRDLLLRGDLLGFARLRHRLLGLSLGYGYQAWRALVGLLLTLAAAVVLVAVLSGATGAVRTVPAEGGPPPSRCSTVDQIGLGVDLAVPLLDTGTRDHCDLVATTAAEEPFVAVGWALQAFGWAFATLFVAGYTGLIRSG